ncbi:MAG: hypothetical protein RLY20_96 [Verrucomicrobiota bacterium]
MKLVFTSTEVPELNIIQDMLERIGVKCELRSSTPLDALGAEPFSAGLWVMEDADYVRARDLFHVWSHPAAHHASNWDCPKCHTQLSGAFDTCWKCGTHHLMVA